MTDILIHKWTGSVIMGQAFFFLAKARVDNSTNRARGTDADAVGFGEDAKLLSVEGRRQVESPSSPPENGGPEEGLAEEGAALAEKGVGDEEGSVI